MLDLFFHPLSIIILFRRYFPDTVYKTMQTLNAYKLKKNKNTILLSFNYLLLVHKRNQIYFSIADPIIPQSCLIF